jgi:2-polyprenyl-3-methyl-5-hydroxy-6-metoxy-1,4-benzoquinol methylase
VNTANHDLTTRRVKRSQQFFNRWSLFFYDFLLYGVISKYAWGSSIQRLDSHYKKYVKHNHLEVGVGTGFLLNRVVFDSAHPRLALMDLSRECLEKTKRKVARYSPETYLQNLLEPIQHKIDKFDSIGINYVMHCVPGNFKEKGVAFTHLQALLSENGILFGTTVLSEDIHQNLLAKPFMWLMNSLGVFNNRGDNARDLNECLERHFQLIEFEVVGVTAFFAVKNSADLA